MQTLPFACVGSSCLCRECLWARGCLLSSCGQLIAHTESCWHPSTSFAIIINKQVPVAETGRVSCIVVCKKDPQSKFLLLFCFFTYPTLHLPYLVHLLRWWILAASNMQLSVCSISNLLCFLSCNTFLALLLVLLILLILKWLTLDIGPPTWYQTQRSAFDPVQFPRKILKSISPSNHSTVSQRYLRETGALRSDFIISQSSCYGQKHESGKTAKQMTYFFSFYV